MSFKPTYESGFDEDGQLSNDSSSQCPECDGRVATNGVETHCEDCGLVLGEDTLDRGPEWRAFDDDGDSRARTGAPLTPARHDRGLSTVIGRGGDASGSPLSSSKRRRISRIRRQHQRAIRSSTAEQNQMYGLLEVRRIAHALGFETGLRNQACRLFSDAQAADLLRGRSIEGIAAASVYAMCRCNGLPRPVSEIAGVAQVDRGRLEHAYRVLNRDLGLPAQPVEPVTFVDSIGSAVGLSRDVHREARVLAERAQDAGLANGRKPAGVAAGCLYQAAQELDEPVTQRELARAGDLSSPTVRSRWKEIKDIQE